MYFYGDYKKAEELFKKYIDIGYSKLDKAYYFLSVCMAELNLPEQREEVLRLKRKTYHTIHNKWLNK